MSINRNVVVTARKSMPWWMPEAETETIYLQVRSGPHYIMNDRTVKCVMGDGLGFSRDYFTDDDGEAVELFMREHNRVVLSIATDS